MTDSENLSFDDMLNIITSDPTMPYEELQKNETALRVDQIISSMPDNLREILLLSYFKRFSYKQMAEILSIPIGTVKSRLHTAVGRLAKDLKESLRTKEVK
jgi:RNA polymerase sigma-70 factor (ECF subfamily)